MTPGNTGTLIGQTLGEYELLSLLGAGGMAEVYRAKDPKLDREVAVKVLPASLAMDAGYVERFRDEAKRVAALNHPNVVPVYHYGEERGLLFLVMPVLRESLRDRMERDGVLPVSEASRYVVQVAAALDAAHAQGLVHRDVKPENILINAEGKALLTDFGIAREASFLKRTGSNRTLAATGLPVGTPEYMAPEQLRAGLVDQRADIYALGAVLYELLTGTVPHEAPTPYEVAALVLTAPLTPPSRRNPAIWPQLEQVVMKALASDPNGRYPNTRTFAMAVRDAVLHRDSSVSRLTMPAVSAEIPILAGLAAKPQSGALPDLGSASAPAENAPAEDTPTEAPAPAPAYEPFGGSRHTWRKGFQPKRAAGGRKALLVISVVVLVLAGVCGGTGIAILNGFNLPLVGSSFPSPFGSSTAGSATNTTSATSTTGSGTGITRADATATAGAPGAPTATSPAGGPPPPAPTNTPIPPTATPTPIRYLQVSNVNMSQPQTAGQPQRHQVCTGSQTITNTGNSTIGWTWDSNPWGQNTQYFIGFNSFSGTPSDTSPGIGPGQTDNVTIVIHNCTTNGFPFNLTLTDTNNVSYPFTVGQSGGG